mmetsp:Transcript_9038/g.11545  ORF Transcript_9038/g.11545 Transcript_9038/m.11545 type:complete len:127 (+) Transcript_9038:1127-1507(+)
MKGISQSVMGHSQKRKAALLLLRWLLLFGVVCLFLLDVAARKGRCRQCQRNRIEETRLQKLNHDNQPITTNHNAAISFSMMTQHPKRRSGVVIGEGTLQLESQRGRMAMCEERACEWAEPLIFLFT